MKKEGVLWQELCTGEWSIDKVRFVARQCIPSSTLYVGGVCGFCSHLREVVEHELSFLLWTKTTFELPCLGCNCAQLVEKFWTAWDQKKRAIGTCAEPHFWMKRFYCAWSMVKKILIRARRVFWFHRLHSETAVNFLFNTLPQVAGTGCPRVTRSLSRDACLVAASAIPLNLMMLKKVDTTIRAEVLYNVRRLEIL